MTHCQKTRQIYVAHTLLTMGSEYIEDENGAIWVDDDQWFVLLPDEDPEAVLVSFNENARPEFVADIISRFSGLLQLIGLLVIPMVSFSDCNSMKSSITETIH